MKKHFSTKVKPKTMITVSGPCSLIVDYIKEHGQIEISFEIDSKTMIEKFSLKKDKKEK